MTKRTVRVLAIAIYVSSSIAVLAAGDNPRKAFAESWRGKRVEIKRTLFTLAFNERAASSPRCTTTGAKGC